MPIVSNRKYEQPCKICGRPSDDLRTVIDETRKWMSGDRIPEWPDRSREDMADLTLKYKELWGALAESLQFAETVLFNCDWKLSVAARANVRLMLDRFMAVQHICEAGLASWERYQYVRGITHLKRYPHTFADEVIQTLESRLERLAQQGIVTSSYKPKEQDWHALYADLSRFGVHFAMGAEGDRRIPHYEQLIGVAHFCVCGARHYIEPAWEEYRRAA